MVIGHAVPHDTFVGTFIYKWHMPLFFFFSGYFFNVDKYSFGKFAYRKIRSLYFPYVFWALSFLSIHNLLILYHISDEQIYDFHDLKVYAFRAVFEMRYYEPLLLTFWFLVQLFFTNYLCYLIFLSKKKLLSDKNIGIFSNNIIDNIIDVSVILLLIISSILFCEYNVVIYFNFNYITLLAMVFFLIGNKLKTVDLTKKSYLIISFIVVLCFGNSFHQMIELESNYIIIYAIIAVCGIIFVYGVSKMIDKKCNYINGVLAYVGDKSLSIMIFHLVAFKLISYIIIWNEGLSINKLSLLVIRNVKLYWTLLYILIGVALPLLLDKGYNYIKCLVLSKFNIN